MSDVVREWRDKHPGEAVPDGLVLTQPWPSTSTEKARGIHARLGPASLVLYDVTTLHFETDAGDGFREPGFSKQRHLDPQITLGLLTDAAGFPLTVAAFEGNKAEIVASRSMSCFVSCGHITVT